MRLFLDANVVFSASLRQPNRQYAFFELASVGHCRLLTSERALDEAQRNLVRKAPHALPHFAGLRAALDVVPEAPDDLLLWGLSEKDAPILAAAVACGADLGDIRRHLIN
jgi:predicted nucleic acid-binding protein